MNIYFLIGVIILIITAFVLLAVRKKLKDKADAFDDDIDASFTSLTLSNYNQEKEAAEGKNNGSFDDIASIIAQRYDDRYIPERGEKEVEEYFSEIYNDAYSLRSRLEAFHIEPSYKLDKLISDYGSLHSLIKQHNDKVISDHLERNKVFFDTCLAYPLDNQQRRSIVSEEEFHSFIDNKLFEQTQNYSNIQESPVEITREMFLDEL